MIREYFYLVHNYLMTKSDLIAGLSEKLDISKRLAGDMINCFIDLVTEGLKTDGEVRLTGFGTFKRTHRAARAGVNPRSGEKIQIAARHVPTFKAGSELKKAVA